MRVEVVTATQNPLDVISLAAGTCYGKETMSDKRVERCLRSGHMSVFEHASATFDVDGISRSCSHQLVRHRLASFSQMSQRYCKVDVGSDDWYVTPFDVIARADAKRWFDECMSSAASAYTQALEMGLKPEDARFLLPEACKTRLKVTMNCRELFHFLELRQGNGAQWEIRALADAMESSLSRYDNQWKTLIGMWNAARCA